MKKLLSLILILGLFACSASVDLNDDDLNLIDAQKSELLLIGFISLILVEAPNTDACDSFEVIEETNSLLLTYDNCPINEISPLGIDCGDLTISSSSNITDSEGDFFVSGTISFSHSKLFPEKTTCDFNINIISYEGADDAVTGTICEENISVDSFDSDEIIANSEICSLE
jgi:hypothetical protein